MSELKVKWDGIGFQNFHMEVNGNPIEDVTGIKFETRAGAEVPKVTVTVVASSLVFEGEADVEIKKDEESLAVCLRCDEPAEVVHSFIDRAGRVVEKFECRGEGFHCYEKRDGMLFGEIVNCIGLGGITTGLSR